MATFNVFLNKSIYVSLYVSLYKLSEMQNVTCQFLRTFFHDCLSAMNIPALRTRDDNIATAKETVDKLIAQLTRKEDHILVSLHQCVSTAKQCHREKKTFALKDKMMEHRRLQTQLQRIRQLKNNALLQLDLIDNDEINHIFVTAMQSLAPKSIVPEDMKVKIEDVVQDTQDTMQEVQDISNMLAQPILRNSAARGEEFSDADAELEFESLLSASDSEENLNASMAYSARLPSIVEEGIGSGARAASAAAIRIPFSSGAASVSAKREMQPLKLT
jgi:hypothetical protein